MQFGALCPMMRSHGTDVYRELYYYGKPGEPVYDALVSKRCYTDSMPFDKADAIIMEGMGTQFDKSLEKYYVAARPKLEEYYRGLQSE